MARPRTPAGRARETHARLAEVYPGAAVDLCELRHRSPFELLVATILSAQCTDKKVNEVTPALFARYPDPVTLASAEEGELQELIRPTGFYQAKTRSLLGMANALVDRFDGVVPPRMEDLVTLPGVGRKTANVILSVAFGLPGLPVDTHVLRLTHRLGLTAEDDPVKVEAALNAMLPAAERGLFSLRVILHGRRTCGAKKPDCPGCGLNDFCPSSTTRAKGRARS
jgi:endonuclease-3